MLARDRSADDGGGSVGSLVAAASGETACPNQRCHQRDV